MCEAALALAAPVTNGRSYGWWYKQPGIPGCCSGASSARSPTSLQVSPFGSRQTLALCQLAGFCTFRPKIAFEARLSRSVPSRGITRGGRGMRPLGLIALNPNLCSADVLGMGYNRWGCQISPPPRCQRGPAAGSCSAG